MGRIIDVLIATGSVFGAQYAGRELSPTDNRSVRRWYTKLEKPAVTPPAPVFAVVWTVLDGLLAYSGYKLLRAEKSSARTVALCFWALCVAGVAGFPFVLFRERRLDASLALCISLIMASGGAISSAEKVNKCAAWAQVPFFVWLVFATFLQEEVWRRN